MTASVIKLGVLFSAINKTNPAFNALNRQLDKVSKKTLSVKNNLQKFRLATDNVLNVRSFLAFSAGKEFIKLGAALEKTRVSFEVLTGSASKGNALFTQINNLANITPYMNDQLLKSSKTMLGFGVAQKEIVPYLSMLGDIAMGDSHRMSSLTLAFSQMQSAGRLMGQDLLQMINAGFNPLGVIAGKTGKSIGQLKEEMAKGAISSQMVIQAFKAATAQGGKFYRMSERISKTAAGKWSTAMGQMKVALAESSEAVLPSLIPIIDWMIKGTTAVSSFVNENRALVGVIGKAGVSLAVLYLGVKAFKPLYYGGMLVVSGLNKMRLAVIGVSTAMRTLSALQKAQNLASYYGALQQAGSLAPITERLFKVRTALSAVTMGQRRFNLSVLANPYVLAIAGIAALAGGIYAYAKATQKATSLVAVLNETKRKAKQKSINERADLYILMNQIKNTNKSSKERARLVDKLVRKYPKLLKKQKLMVMSNEELIATERSLGREIEQRALKEAQISMLKNELKNKMVLELENTDYKQLLKEGKTWAAGVKYINPLSWFDPIMPDDINQSKIKTSEKRIESLKKIISNPTINITVNGNADHTTAKQIGRAVEDAQRRSYKLEPIWQPQ